MAFAVSTATLPSSTRFFEKLYQIFLKATGRLPKRDVENLKDLPELYKAVLKMDIKPHERSRVAKLVERSFDNLKKIYEVYREDRSIQAMALKNDILEAVAVAVKKNGLNSKLGLSITRVAADAIKPFSGRVRNHHIPLFRMQDLPRVIVLMKEKFPGYIPSLQEIHADEQLRKYLIIERVAMGSIVHWMYKNTRMGKLLNNSVFSYLITQISGYLHKRVLKPGKRRTQTILKFFKRLDIRLETDLNGKLYSYREMFKKSLREETSCDGAFQRALNRRSLKLLMKPARQTARILQKQSENFTAPVISNSYCRLRMLDIFPRSVRRGFTITGKTLNINSSGVCTLQNMLGNENAVDTSFTSSKPAVELQSRRHAEYLYRCCLTNAIDRQKMSMIIQRLAPADVHHFVETVGGRVLSHQQACAKLLQMLEGENQPQEKEQLQKLYAYFERYPSDEAVVKVRGTRMSVSTLATRYQSPLSQNDRKIMLIEHPGGSISIHIFIGAVGVNNVSISARSGKLENGDPIGAMGFGDDSQRRNQWDTMATNKESIRLRCNSQESLAQGARRGRFSKEGSTVVSLYTHFRPLPTLALAKETLRYKDFQGVVRDIEIQAQMGNIIGKIV